MSKSTLGTLTPLIMFALWLFANFLVCAGVDPESSSTNYVALFIAALCCISCLAAGILAWKYAGQGSLVALSVLLIMVVVAHFVFWLGVRKVRTAVGPKLTINRVKMLALAMHDYEKEHGTLPPPAIYDKDGKALLSWRVKLVSFLDLVQRWPFAKFVCKKRSACRRSSKR